MYGLVFVYATIVYWRSSVGSIVAMMLLCAGSCSCIYLPSPSQADVLSVWFAGDGFAGLVGFRFGRAKLPHNRNKTWLGSISFFVASMAAIVVFANMFAQNGWLVLSPSNVFLPKIAIIVAVATVVESLPICA
jgi:dolichol kinase